MRSKLVFLSALVATTLALGGCSVDQIASQVASNLGSVSGTVVDGAGAPVVSASVHVENTGYSTLTNVEGRYLLSLPAGTYTLTATHPEGGTAQATATVVGGEAPASADFQLDRDRTVVAATVALTTDRLFYRAGETVKMKLAVANATQEAIAFTFRSGQKFDFVVRDGRGRLAWQWSAGKTFTDENREESLGAGKTWTFEASWDRSVPTFAEGPVFEPPFTVEGFLTAEPRPASARATFEVEAAKPRVEPVEFRSLSSGSESAWPKPAAFAILDKEILLRVWESMHGGSGAQEIQPSDGSSTPTPTPTPLPLQPAPVVDFERYMVLALFLGTQPQSGTTVEIVRVEKLGAPWLDGPAGTASRLVVLYRVVTTDATTVANTDGTCSPYHLVAVPRLQLPIEFRPFTE